MDLRQIEYVEAVARNRNFTRAAEELHVAQPALSVSIRRLEEELGVRLFDRTSRRVELTDAGAAFLERAGRVSSELARIPDEMRDYAAGARGRVRLSCWYHVEPRLAAYMQAIFRAIPRVEVVVSELGGADAVQALRSGEIDIALVLLSPDEELPGLEQLVIRREPYALAMPANHRFAGRSEVTLAEVVHEPFIVTRPGTSLRRCFDRVFARRVEVPRIAIETNELAAIVAYVAAGLGCAILTETIVDPFSTPVRLARLTDAMPFILAVVWTPGDHVPAVERALQVLWSGPPGEPWPPTLHDV